MNNFIEEKYLIFVNDNNISNKMFYIIEKYNNRKLVIKQIRDNKKVNVNLSDIEDKELYESLSNLINKIKLKNIASSSEYLLKFVKERQFSNFLEYANVEEYKTLKTKRYDIRVVRYYLNPKGRLYEKLFGTKWKVKR